MLRVIRGLAADDVTVLVSSHNMTELEGVCDSITVMQSGRSVWDGSMARLRAESPAPAHRIETSDDAKATELARGHHGVAVVADPDGWLTVSADPEPLDAFVVALGRAGVAVRRLELVMSALESMFFALTGAAADHAEAERSSDEIGAVG
jgi:ABC-2 type transport system ATP-binding protein